MKKSVDEYRADVTIHLTRISGDIGNIKHDISSINDKLSQINGRVRATEQQISWMKGIGSTFIFVVGSILAWLGIEK